MMVAAHGMGAARADALHGVGVLRERLPAADGHGCASTDAWADALRGPTVHLKLPGDARRHVHWGQEWQLGTAAYWTALARGCSRPASYRLGRSLAEELAACLLGGYGMPAALGSAAFARLLDDGLLQPGAHTAAQLEQALRRPLVVDGSARRYRFPRQRAERLDAALGFLRRAGRPPRGDVALRDWLVAAPGVGMKTASWVVRNHRGSDAVAVIDIHVVRAGMAAGVFDPAWRLPRDYRTFEDAFLTWAAAGAVSAALLDSVIWSALANAGAAACDVLGVRRLADVPTPVWPCTCDGPPASSPACAPVRRRDGPASAWAPEEEMEAV